MPLIACPDCSRRISGSVAACPGCSRPMRVYLPATPLRGDEVMEGLRAYVGPNWDSHYRYSFGQLLYAERKGLGAGWTWNWSAALTPYFAWFVYRRLHGAAAALWGASFVGGVLLAFVASELTTFTGLVWTLLVVGFAVVQGFLADRLLFARARAAVGDGTSVPRAELARKGAPLRWVLWTSGAGAFVGVLALMGLGLFLAFEDDINTWRASRPERTVVRADGWVWFESRLGEFKAAFPHHPAYSTSMGATENRYTAEYRDGAVLRVTFEDGHDERTIGIGEHFRRLDVRAPLRPAPVLMGEHPGMEATYETGEGADAMVVHHRIYQVGGRLYQLTATMKKADPAPAEVERFFSSFQLTSE